VQHDFVDHTEPEAPGPPRARQLLGLTLMLLGGLVLLGVVPFGLTTFGVVVILVGAGLVV
jgi:hypothetical protein